MKQAIKLPEAVAIGPVSYSVREDAAYLASMRRHCNDHRYAETEFATTTMVIDPHLSPSRKRETFMHECVHALLCEYNCQPEDDAKEERLVESLGMALLALIRDNPSLIRYLVA